MRRLAFTVFATMLVLALTSAYSVAKDETVDEMKTRFESARPEDRAELGIRIAQQELRNADRLYKDGNAEQARASVDDIATYSEKARDAATKTNKRLKNVEIEVRKIADKLRDIKRTLPFDDQGPIDRDIRRLEDVRTTLLKAMFAKDEKKENK
ncbi:MAG: hypothetical protein WBD25_16705 [Terriglobales bacterium]